MHDRFGHEFPASGVRDLGLVCRPKTVQYCTYKNPFSPLESGNVDAGRASARTVAKRPQRKFRRGAGEGIGRARSFRAICARAVTRSRDCIPPGGDGGPCGGTSPRMSSANMKRVPRPPAPGTERASPQSIIGILQKIRSNWQEALFGGMILASLAGAIYMFSQS